MGVYSIYVVAEGRSSRLSCKIEDKVKYSSRCAARDKTQNQKVFDVLAEPEKLRVQSGT